MNRETQPFSSPSVLFIGWSVFAKLPKQSEGDRRTVEVVGIGVVGILVMPVALDGNDRILVPGTELHSFPDVGSEFYRWRQVVSAESHVGGVGNEMVGIVYNGAMRLLDQPAIHESHTDA